MVISIVSDVSPGDMEGIRIRNTHLNRDGLNFVVVLQAQIAMISIAEASNYPGESQQVLPRLC
jgi:hypothetical protein